MEKENKIIKIKYFDCEDNFRYFYLNWKNYCIEDVRNIKVSIKNYLEHNEFKVVEDELIAELKLWAYDVEIWKPLTLMEISSWN